MVNIPRRLFKLPCLILLFLTLQSNKASAMSCIDTYRVILACDAKLCQKIVTEELEFTGPSCRTDRSLVKLPKDADFNPSHIRICTTQTGDLDCEADKDLSTLDGIVEQWEREIQESADRVRVVDIYMCLMLLFPVAIYAAWPLLFRKGQRLLAQLRGKVRMRLRESIARAAGALIVGVQFSNWPAGLPVLMLFMCLFLVAVILNVIRIRHEKLRYRLILGDIPLFIFVLFANTHALLHLALSSQFVERLVAARYPFRLEASMQEIYRREDSTFVGCKVTDISENTMGSHRNILRGDIIVEIEGNKLDDRIGCKNELSLFENASGPISYKVLRNGKEKIHTQHSIHVLPANSQ